MPGRLQILETGLLPAFPNQITFRYHSKESCPNAKMSFQLISERLKTLQESNAQLKELIERLATINFQPGSVRLGDDEDGNVLHELAAEIHQTIRDQDEDFELLKEEVEELDEGKRGSEMEQQKAELKGALLRGVRELKTSVVFYTGRLV